MSDIFSIGVTGLNVAKTALGTIANNVANANSPGYSRQIVQSSMQPGTASGGFYVGSGTQVTGIRAMTSQFLENQLTGASGKRGYSTELDSLYGSLEGILSGSTNGISDNLASVKTALTSMAANPSSVPARQQFLSSLQGLSSAFSNINAALNQLQQTANQNLSDAANSANSLMKKIASLNDSISLAERKQGDGTILEGDKANDLRDERQQTINQLGQLMQITTIDQPEGISVIAGGTALVVGNRSSSISASPDPNDATKSIVNLKTLAGNVNLDPSALGGKIAADYEFLNQGVGPSLARVNQYAGVMAQAINDQLQKGQNLYNQMGSNLIQVDAPVAASASNNTGSLSLGISVNAYQTEASNYKMVYSTVSGYTVTRLSDGKGVANGASLPLSFDGVTLSGASGVPANGDSYLIKPLGESSGAFKVLNSDPKALALASPLAGKAASSNTSTSTINPMKITSGLPLNPNLADPVTITFTSATQYTISSASIGTLTGQSYTSGATIAYNGWSTQIVGTPKIGDTFTIGPVNNNTGDSGNANDLIGLLEGKNFASGLQTLADFSANIQSTVGTQASLASTNAKSDASLFNLAQADRDNYSGVNLDEEAANLAKWQQIYSANAQVIATAKQMFNQLMSTFG